MHLCLRQIYSGWWASLGSSAFQACRDGGGGGLALLRTPSAHGRGCCPQTAACFPDPHRDAIWGVNLLRGVNPSETPVTCTAGVGTFILEFSTLSRLTGDPVFENVARKSLRALWRTRSDIGLVKPFDLDQAVYRTIMTHV
ncbi:probable alpha-mannosidase I MNS4 [Sinocyclocheilus grahami]|uniref:probable alpha-mannosidase I MNS4 n=1 Tax=Sinocyclocheilus grahami TaxID=75366 RepID=UPI0007ACBA7F|nr:PREDICTED: probable alpha-mannosidase I MNS4 [Sinocyclocheilus grahami]